MEVSQALKTRRSIKSYAPTPISRELLLELVEAARHSPSGGNKNPWRFVITTRRETLERLSQTHPFCKWLASAQAGIALAADPAQSRYWLEDLSIAAYGIWLAATEKGLGVAWAAIYQSDNPAESERRQGFVRETLGIPSGFQVPIVLALGYPQSQPPERKRPSLEEVVSWERFQPTGA